MIKDNIYAPKKELVYSDKVEKEGTGGNYITTFKLKFSNPQGQTGGMNLFSYPKGCDMDNMKTLVPSGIELKNGTTYSISEHEITCTTKEPIIENNRRNLLFEIKK